MASTSCLFYFLHLAVALAILMTGMIICTHWNPVYPSRVYFLEPCLCLCPAQLSLVSDWLLIGYKLKWKIYAQLIFKECYILWLISCIYAKYYWYLITFIHTQYKVASCDAHFLENFKNVFGDLHKYRASLVTQW